MDGSGGYDPADVAATWMTGRGGRPKARNSRAEALSDARLVLTHMPTGTRVEGAVPRGHYARAELSRLKDELRARLMAELEPKARAAIKAARR